MLDIFIQRLKMLRNSRGLTQEAFANALNCSREAIASYETGNSTPPIEVLIQIADYLEVNLDFLVGRSQSPKMGLPSISVEDDDFFTSYYKLSQDDQERLKSVVKVFREDYKKV